MQQRHDDPVYPDAKRSTTFQDGLEFQDLVCRVLARKENIILQNVASKKWQLVIGENFQGFEIKEDRRSSDTKRLSIEIAEKSKASNPQWVPSGIYRSDKSWLYVQGNRDFLFVFARLWLTTYCEKVKPQIKDQPTIRTFFLPLEQCERMALKTIWLADRANFIKTPVPKPEQMMLPLDLP